MQDFRIKPKDEGDVAYAKGMEGQEKGLLRRENPYHEGTERWDQWDTGWCDQYYETTGEYAPPAGPTGNTERRRDERERL